MRTLLAVFALALSVSACTSGGASRRPEEQTPRQGITATTACSEDIDRLVQRVQRGYVPARGPELSVIPHEPHYVGLASKPTHNGPWDYLAEVPLVFYGPGIVDGQGHVNERATMADIAPTTAALIGFDGFVAPDGHVLKAVRSSIVRHPRLVVTIVWDGAGDNMLAAHPDRWPFLATLMRKGISFGDMEIGSSPSVTPPVHATLGTGAWPRRHGIYSVMMRGRDGSFVDPWEAEDPKWLKVPTLSDVYDAALGNRPLTGMTGTVNWHLGMLGHGAAFPGGDSDPAALINSVGSVYGNATFYELPSAVDPARLELATRRIDLTDGQHNQAWRGHDLTDLSVRYASPATAVYQEDVLENLIQGEGFGKDDVPDLLYVNFKQTDGAAHHWGMTSEEVGIVLTAQDDALARLVTFLDRIVGRERWVVVLTADHGFMPSVEESGAWPINGGELKQDLNRAATSLDVVGEPVTRAVSAGLYLSQPVDAKQIKTLGEWVAAYSVAQNVQNGGIPDGWETRRDEPLFDAVMTEDGGIERSCRERA
jgi:type I phosphodiesterase/nucleotide pyrophosphatase